jgi:hypothetical protein
VARLWQIHIPVLEELKQPLPPDINYSAQTVALGLPVFSFPTHVGRVFGSLQIIAAISHKIILKLLLCLYAHSNVTLALVKV